MPTAVESFRSNFSPEYNKIKQTKAAFKAYVMMTHQMDTFSVLLVLCAGNSPVNGEFPSQSPVTRSFDVFFDLGLNKRLSKQSRRRWFEAPLRSLWSHCNVLSVSHTLSKVRCMPGCLEWKIIPTWGNMLFLFFTSKVSYGKLLLQIPQQLPL